MGNNQNENDKTGALTRIETVIFALVLAVAGYAFVSAAVVVFSAV